jgi:NAD(P)-dependent dehydrogenase (short-subunit alcohol dehydrogenase family)
MARLDGKVAIITGASRGIGAAAARAFAAEGACVVLVARDAAATARVAQEIGPAALAQPGDVAEPAAMEAAVARAHESFGRLDVLVANAAVIDPIAPLAEADAGDWMRALAVNVGGAFCGLRACLPAMLKGGGGTVVTIGSGAAQTPLEGWSAYCSSKAALLMLMRCAHHELKGRGLRAFSLSPGTVATDMQRRIKASGVNPVARIPFEDHAPPEEPARALVWLCTPDADPYRGAEISLRDPAIRARIGLA